MRWCAILALAAVSAGALVAQDPDDDAARRHLQRFQGTWNVESWEDAGKAVPAADLKKRTVFFGANILVRKADGKTAQVGVLRLDPSHDPKTFNLSVKEGDGKDEVILGVYEFDGDAVRLCYDPKGRDRPDGFKPPAKAGCVVAVLRRPTPPADEALDITGKFKSELVEPDGKTVVTEAEIERWGDAYRVTYRKDGKVAFLATALRRGDQLSMCWVSAGQVGVSVYKIEKGPKLTGDFTTLTGLGVVGREVMTRVRQVD
jgi:uncharacterized protein (TIGR03067 family)